MKNRVVGTLCDHQESDLGKTHPNAFVAEVPTPATTVHDMQQNSWIGSGESTTDTSLHRETNGINWNSWDQNLF